MCEPSVAFSVCAPIGNFLREVWGMIIGFPLCIHALNKGDIYQKNLEKPVLKIFPLNKKNVVISATEMMISETTS